MASALKHKKRSSRYNQSNIIPVNIFATHANKVANAKFFRNMRSKIAAAQSKEESTES